MLFNIRGNDYFKYVNKNNSTDAESEFCQSNEDDSNVYSFLFALFFLFSVVGRPVALTKVTSSALLACMHFFYAPEWLIFHTTGDM